MDLLWKKDSRNQELYVDIFKSMSTDYFDSRSKTLSEVTATFKKLKLNQKDDRMSSKYRNDGNMKFKTEDWLEAMSLYNQSLCYAEIGSESVSLAYANRSACFLHLNMYNECLVDIELAKQAKYPAEMMPKLDKRREDCLKLIDTYENKTKLIYEADERFPGMANVLEIRYDKKFGRHIVAKCDIPAGEIILAEKSFITRWLNTRYNSCAICAKISMNFIACTQCTTALFCNIKCDNVNDLHKIDCGEPPNSIREGPLDYYLGALIFIIGIYPNVECLIEFVENAITEEEVGAPHSLENVKSKFRALLQLSSNKRPTKEKNDERLNEAHIIYKSILLRKSIKQLFDTEQKKRFLMHLVLHLNCIMINNGFTAMKQKMSIYIISSYFNHSCAPNVLGLNTDENVRYCRTVRPIKAEQQLFISYLMDTSAHPDHDFIDEINSHQRQKILYENFGFRCKCERCVPNMKFWKMNSHNMRSDRFIKWLHTSFDSFLNDGSGVKKEKAAMVEKKIVDALNRFGDKHWCDELAALIATYETFS